MYAWGKFDESSGRFHRLEHHCADVAACFEALLLDPVLRARFARAAGASDLGETTAARLTLLAFLHDFDKLNAGFQIYRCQRLGIQRAEPVCQNVPGAAIGHAVSELVLETVTPASIDVAVEVFDELPSRAAAIDRAKRAQIARLREDAELAQRQFLLVRPENRLVADNLERHWNEALQRLAAAEEAYAGAGKAETPAITPEMQERVAALVTDLPRVWHDPRTPARDRKRMLRLLIDDVTLLRDDVIRVSIRWRGGATREIECPLPLGAPDLRRTPATVVELVRALATEQTDAQIAETLNGR